MATLMTPGSRSATVCRPDCQALQMVSMQDAIGCFALVNALRFIPVHGLFAESELSAHDLSRLISQERS